MLLLPANSTTAYSSHVKILVDSLFAVEMVRMRAWLTLCDRFSTHVLTDTTVSTDGDDSLASDSDGDKSENHAEAAPSAVLQSENGASDEETSEEDSDE